MTDLRTPTLLVVDDTTPSRMLTMGDITVGDAVEQHFAFDAAARKAFSIVANDRAPLHEDERFARKRGFSGTIIQGLCVVTRFSRLIGMYLPGEHAILEAVDFKYRYPIIEGQMIIFRAQVTRLLKPMKVVRIELTATSETGVHVSGVAQCLIR